MGVEFDLKDVFVECNVSFGSRCRVVVIGEIWKMLMRTAGTTFEICFEEYPTVLLEHQMYSGELAILNSNDFVSWHF